MKEVLCEEWQDALAHVWEQQWFQKLQLNVDKAYQANTCYPPRNLLFNAFNLCLPKSVRVVILGQDPYHGVGQAHGLSFSVPNGVPHPPSLVNIFREISSDLGITPQPWGNLERWATQGVFLLNTSLSVEAGKAGSHATFGWEHFTNAVIDYVNDHQEGVVFLLWGNHAKKMKKRIDPLRHHILESGHPSPLSANRGLWFGNKHFSKVNAIVNRPIDWS